MVLALGNDILGDDAVGFHALRRLRAELSAAGLEGGVDFAETGEAGLALLDLLEDYRRGIILDAVVTGKVPPGTVLEFSRQDFRRLAGASPHTAGLPELLHVAERTGMRLPDDLRVLALEVATPDTFSESLTPGALEALPAFVARGREILECWARADLL